MLHRRFVGRVLVQSRRQAAVLALCTALSLISLVALEGFAAGVRRTLIEDARRLQAADVIVRANLPFSPALTAAVEGLVEAGRIAAVRVHEFYSVARAAGGPATLLSQVKVVEAGYPFYGAVELAGGRALAEVLRPGTVVVEPAVLERLGMAVGDRLHLGETTLTVAGVILVEPDRPVDLFSLGPRILAGAADLEAMDLVRHGSRVRHRYLVRVLVEAQVPAVVETLSRAALAGQETVETAGGADSRLKRFFDNLRFFLGLVGIFTLLLAGLGIQSALTALLKDQERTIALMRALGATRGFVTTQFLVLVVLVGLAGTVLGLTGGALLQHLLPRLFGGLIPAGTRLGLEPRALVEGGLLGVAVVFLFAFLPLYRLGEVRPAAILQAAEQTCRRGPAYVTAAALAGLFFVGMILWQVQDPRIGLLFVAGTLALVGIIWGLTLLVLGGLRRIPVGGLVLRQAVRGLFRPRNATASIMVTLAAALAVIFATLLVERNLNATFVQSFPEDAPNLFLLDIQPAQQAALAAELGPAAAFYPVVRARMEAINGVPVDRDSERRRRRDNLARTFNLTYRDGLLDDEVLTVGRALFRSDWPPDRVQVSVLEGVREMHAFQVGDRIRFNIQGVPLEAVVSSVRDRTRDSLKPFFYFVFQPEVLAAAPQTRFAALRVPAADIGRLQSRIVAAHPNVSVIDATAAARDLGRILRRLGTIVRFFAAFSVLAGLLIVVSSVMATRAARIREAVYFKILGARQAFVNRVFALENLLIGLISGILAAAAAQAGAGAICTRILDIGYRAYPAATLGLLAAAPILVMAVGMAASRGILRRKPEDFLRRQDA